MQFLLFSSDIGRFATIGFRTPNFKQVIKNGDLRLHPLITRLVDKETLEKMGAKPVGEADAKTE